MAAGKNVGGDAGATGSAANLRASMGAADAAPKAAASSSAPIKVPMTAEHWQLDSAAFEKIQGMDAIALHQGGTAIAKDITLKDGTIEFDVQPMVMGTGVVFRRQDEKTYEMFYFRPNGKCAEAPDCLQYAPETHNILLWDVFPQYQAPAPIHDGEWNHVKLVISGKRMNMYINHSATPTLRVGRLEGDAGEGAVGLSGPGYFANFVVTPNATEGFVAGAGSRPNGERCATGAELAIVAGVGACGRERSKLWRDAGGFGGVETDHGRAWRADRHHTGIWVAAGAAEAVDGVDQNDDRFGQGADDSYLVRVGARGVGVCEWEAGLCRQEFVYAGKRAEESGREVGVDEWRV